MNSLVLSRIFKEPPFCEKEILRYAGSKGADREVSAVLEQCINEVRDRLVYKVCYCEFYVKINGDICDFGAFKLQSENLALNLKGCEKVIVFAATVGVELDRLIVKYGHISPVKALLFQAIGAERIEALCDAFCEDIANQKKLSLRPRFSPGYGDLPLEVQKDIFAVLDCGRRMGLTLNNSMLMSPSKSVTAFVGTMESGSNQSNNKCSICDNRDCSFRSAL